MNKEVINNIKDSTQVVILNEVGRVLAVSRKDDHSDFGLPGGKVDSEDVSIKSALVREVKEETGLNIKEEDLTLIFAMHDGDYMGHTYFCNTYEGEIETDEPHVVKWVGFNTLFRGSFSSYNVKVCDSLTNMGIKINFY